MKLSTLAPLLLSTLSLVSAAPHPPSSRTSLDCHSEPTTTSDIVKVYSDLSDVHITCQTPSHDGIWSKTSDNCYIFSGATGEIETSCPTHLHRRAIPGPRVNDYLYKTRCGIVDPWRYFTCQCTSFVAQRINQRLGIHFTNTYKGHKWGNANTWDDAARASGVKINKTPKPGCVAQTDVGSAGHVAWVSAVNGDTVVVEEYNWNKKLGYGVRTVAKEKFNYIHFTGST
ncbi:CHAP-domain-containing protein [Wilcoxina mikolae CBS 423.85]|nr:CHAP-domain-containing protein [Wilcoxina mikolae CBS 423.85]